MKYGVSFLPDAAPNEKDPANYLRDAIDLSAAAETAGFGYCKMTEHYLNQYGGYCPSPLTFLAAVAERTSAMRLMTGCVIPALHHPVELAATTAMLDCMSGGRLDVGVARGYMPYEFDAFGVDLDSSRNRYRETLHLLNRLWTEESVTHTGELYTLTDAVSWPKPIQQPHPPLWGAAVRSRESFAWLGEAGFNLLITPGFSDLREIADNVDIYRGSRSESAPPCNVFISLPLLVRSTDEAAQAEGRAQLERYLSVWAHAADSWLTTTSSAYKGYTGMSRGIRAGGVDGLLKTRGAIIGSPFSCAEQISDLIDIVKPDGILWQLDFGGAGRRSMFETLDQFVTNVAASVEHN